jgi:hypothetical protein
MTITFNHQLDLANKILIFEAQGEAENQSDISYLLKTIVKLAGKSQLTRVVFDVTQLTYSCSSLDLSTVFNEVKQYGLLGELKIARVIDPGQFKQELVGDLAISLSLPIKNFCTRSDALVWLLFDVKENS